MIDLLTQHLFFKDKTIESCSLLENQGYCNENYVVVADGVKYIVRKLLRHDIDREFEWEVHTLANELGITAEPLVFDRKQGFMVFAFLDGEHKEVETLVPHEVNIQSERRTVPNVATSKEELMLLATTLQKLHSIKVDTSPVVLHIENKTDEVRKAFEVIENYPHENVLCHNDLNPQNIFFSNEVKLIDWEYAGVNDRYFDLACVCVEFKLDDKMQELFSSAYFKDEDFILKKLEAYKIVYEILCKEWFNSPV